MSRVEWILGGLLVLLLAIVGVLALLLWFQPDVSQPPTVPTQAAVVAPTPVYVGQTALAASLAAQQQATVWQPDAQLYKADATWPQGASVSDLRKGASAWSFTYYSPGRLANAVFTVVDGESSLVTESAVQRPLQLQAATNWKVDSPQAIEKMLREGGEQFINREGITTLIMAMTTDGPDGRSQWFISLFAPQTRHSFTMRLDADSGEVLEVIQAP